MWRLYLLSKSAQYGKNRSENETQNGTVYCLASIKPEGGEVLANHFVLCRFLDVLGFFLASPLPLFFLFSDCFLSGLHWIQEQTRAPESAVVIQQECVSGNGESGIEGSGARKLFPFFSAYTRLAWLSAKAGGQGWQRQWVTYTLSQGIPLQTYQWEFCHWLQLRPIMREMESERVSRMIWKVWGELQDKGSKVAKVGNVIIKLSDTGNTYVVGKKARGRAQLSLDKMFYSFLTLFSCWNCLPRPTIGTARLLACWMLSFKTGVSTYVTWIVNSCTLTLSVFWQSQNGKLLNCCQKMHCILKGFFSSIFNDFKL